MIDTLPKGWAIATLPELVSSKGILTDGDWVETEDQDPSGDVRLTQLADVGDGEFRNRSHRFLTMEKAKVLGCTFLQVGDVLVARMPDPLGRACTFPGDWRPSVTVVDVCVVRPGSELVSSRWLMNFVNAPDSRAAIASLQAGSTRKRISKKNLCTIKMPVPPEREQHRIVDAIESYLTRLDDAVATLKRVQRNLKRYRASVLKAAIEGRLVPIEADLARAEGRTYEPAAVLLEQIFNERRHRWSASGRKGKYQEPPAPDTSGLPELPEGWCWTKLGDVFEIEIGATPSRGKPEYWNGDIPWVSSGEVAFCRIRSTRETITSAGLDNSSTRLHPNGTVLIGMIGEGRTRGQVAILDIAACNNQNAAAIRVSESQVLPEYVFYYLMGKYRENRTLGSGNNQPALNKARVQAMVLPLPPLHEQTRIVRAIERRLSVVDHAEVELMTSSHRSTRLRQSILSWAFEGKLADQDPKDESASVLLARIKAEREAAVSTQKRSNRPKARAARRTA